MKNFVFLIIGLNLLCIFCCSPCYSQILNHTNKLSNNKIGKPVPVNSDNCCEVKYPAQQVEVSSIDLFQKQFRIISFRDPSTNNFKYRLEFSPSPRYEQVSQAYINYVSTLYPCVTGMGSAWNLSKGNFGPGHTTRQVARTNFIGFYPSNSSISTMVINDPPNFWRDYFDPPIRTGAAATPTVNGGLDYNEIYAIDYGFWLDGNCKFSNKEKDCLGYHTSVNFRIQATPNPMRTSQEYVDVTIEYLDKNGEVIKNQILEMQIEN